MGCDAKDFDNDGRIDIIYNDLAGQAFGLLRNEGGQAFADETWTSRMGTLSQRCPDGALDLSTSITTGGRTFIQPTAMSII